MDKIFSLFCLQLFIFSFSFLFSDEKAQRIQAHLTLLDAHSAVDEAFLALKEDERREDLFELYLKALALLGDEKKLISSLKHYLITFPDSKKKEEMIEVVCWGIIECAKASTSPMIRLYALLGAVFANDARSIKVLKMGLQDNNSLIRESAIRLAPHFKDLKVQKEIFRLLKEEPVFRVRLEVIKAFSFLNLKGIEEELIGLIENDRNEFEEKFNAIQSLVRLKEGATRDEIKRLIGSRKPSLRLLASEFILEHELKDEIDLILPLLKDDRREIRKSALNTLGVLGVDFVNDKKIVDFVLPLLNDLDWEVALQAAYVLLLNEEQAGISALLNFIFDERKEVRLTSASALSKSGKRGVPLMKQIFYKTLDPYVKMNLSMGLIGQQEEVQASLKALYKGLNQQKEPFVFIESGNFRYLAPSSIYKEEFIPNEREALNQLARLEILNILSILQFEKAEEAIKNFLQENTWGISALASSLLLSEGDESVIHLVENLLKDPNEKIRIQAALILSLWDSGHVGLSILESAYQDAEREMKERILEGIGRIGSKSSIPFLLACLDEPFWQLRLIAASSLLQTLNH